MKIYPNEYLKSVKDINIDFLNKNNIKALILDIDNTLIDYYKNLEESIIQWAKKNERKRNYIIHFIKHK